MRKALLVAVASCTSLLVGCGGYAREEPPSPYVTPSGGAVAQATSTPGDTPTATGTPTSSHTATKKPRKSPGASTVCPAIGFSVPLRIDVPDGVRAELVRVRVALTQGKRHKDVTFRAQPFSKADPRTFPGTVTKTGYSIVLDGTDFDRIPWTPGKPVTLLVEGIVDDRGGVGYRHRETVRFSAGPPRSCDGRRYLKTFTTKLAVADTV